MEKMLIQSSPILKAVEVNKTKAKSQIKNISVYFFTKTITQINPAAPFGTSM